MTINYSIEEMADRLAIYDLFARYVHAVDDRDLETLDHIFVPETVFNWSDAGGDKVVWSEAKHGDFITGRMFQFVFHLCGNIRIDFDEDRQMARVKSKTIHPTGLKDEAGKAHLFQVHGSYSDVLTRTDVGWRITERKWNHFWAVGGLRLIDGIPEMLQQAGRA